MTYCIRKTRIHTGNWLQKLAVSWCSETMHLFLSKVRVNKNNSNSIQRPKFLTAFITLMTTNLGYSLYKSSVQTLWLSGYLIRCSEQVTGWHKRRAVQISGRRMRLFFKASKSALRPSQPPIQWVPWGHMKCGEGLVHHSSASRLKLSKSVLRRSQPPIQWAPWGRMRCGEELVHHSSASRLKLPKICSETFSASHSMGTVGVTWDVARGWSTTHLHLG